MHMPKHYCLFAALVSSSTRDAAISNVRRECNCNNNIYNLTADSYIGSWDQTHYC